MTPINRWTPAEDAVIRDNWRRGARWCQDRLPSRTKAAIYRRAGILGVVNPPERFQSSPLIDAQLRRAYEQGRGGLAQLSRRIGVPGNTLSRHAASLGLSHRPVRFSEEEGLFIEAHLHLSRPRISALMKKRGWPRTSDAVKRYIATRGLGGIGDYLSVQGLSGCLGLAEHTVRGCIARGELLAERAKGEDGRIVISPSEIARFIVAHPHRIDMRKVEGPWLIDILAQYGSLGLVEHGSQWRRVLALHELGKSNREIAAILEIKANVVAVILCRLRSEARQRGEAA
jgi:hypothetical protein